MYSLCEELKAIGPHFFRSAWHMNMVFMWWATWGNYEFFVSWPFWSSTSIVCQNMFMWITNELLPNNWGFFGSRFRWSPLPSKLEGPHEVILGEFPLFMLQVTYVLPNAYDQVVHNRHLVLRGKKPASKLGIICEGYWFLHLGNTWNRLPQQAMSTYPKTLHAWSIKF